MDITAANAFLFGLTLILVSLIGWFLLRPNGREETKKDSNRKEQHQSCSGGQDSPQLLQDEIKNVIKDDSKIKNQDEEEEPQQEPPAGTEVVQYSGSSSQDDDACSEEHDPIPPPPEKEQTESMVAPLLTTPNSSDDLESELKEATKERQGPVHEDNETQTGETEGFSDEDDTPSRATPPNEDNGEEWIVV